MGEIADMMLDGTLDCETGEYIGDNNKEIFGDESPGFPVSYESDSESNPNNYLKERQERATRPSKKIPCTHPGCKRFVKKAGLKDHLRDVHNK